MEAPVFALFCLAVGYLMYWTVVNEKLDPNGGYEGWFGLRKQKPRKPPPDSARSHPFSKLPNEP